MPYHVQGALPETAASQQIGASNTEAGTSGSEEVRLPSLPSISGRPRQPRQGAPRAYASAAGVAEGGRTGLTSFTTAIFFFVALFFAPVFIMIPGAATAPALVMVGLFMLSPILKIDLNDFTEAIPAFFTIIMMPLTYSIAEGIVFGMLAYVLLKVLTGKFKDISIIMYILAVLFILKFFIH